MSEMPALKNTEPKKTSEENGSSEFNGEQVYVNVYNLHWPNGMKMGAYHTGTVVYGKEYGYGGHPFSSSGIFQIEPTNVDSMGDEFSFKESIYMGRTYLSSKGVERLLCSLADEFQGNAYHLLNYNCNHFTAHFVELLCHATLPGWINRLARVAAGLPFIESMLPPQWVRPSLMYDFDDDDDNDDGDDGEDGADKSVNGDIDNEQVTGDEQDSHHLDHDFNTISIIRVADHNRKPSATANHVNHLSNTHTTASSSNSNNSSIDYDRKMSNHSTGSDKIQTSHSRMIFIGSGHESDKQRRHSSTSKSKAHLLS